MAPAPDVRIRGVRAVSKEAVLKALEAEQDRRLEEDHAPRRLANLPPEQREMARRLMDQVLLGELRDPDALAPESE